MIAQETSPSEASSPKSRAYQAGYPIFGQAPKPRPDGSLQTFRLLTTGPYLANSGVHNLTWRNESGRRLAVYKVYIWTGVDRGGIGDVHVEARRGSDDTYLAILQWDHYTDPTVPQHGQQFDYPSPIIIDPGETIVIKHFVNGVGSGWHAHHVLILWVK